MSNARQNGSPSRVLTRLTGWLGALPSRRRELPVEESTEDGRFLVRAEVPGVAPDAVEVDVRDGALLIKATRGEPAGHRIRTDLRYGTFERTVALPADAKEDDIRARCARGILTISVGTAAGDRPKRRIPVEAEGMAP